MLEHLNHSLQAPKRVVVMGAGGFVGGAIVERLKREGMPVLPLGRAKVDLLVAEAGDRLLHHLRDGDAFVAASAIAPCKTPQMLVQNMVMAQVMVDALCQAPIAHVVNISSDAVYSDRAEPLTESS